MKTKIDSLEKRLFSPQSTATITDVEPLSSTVGKEKKKKDKNMIKQTIEEAERDALKFYSDKLKQKAKSEESKR